jgi:hypothetical protein
MEQIIIKHPDGSQLPLFSKERISAVTKAEQNVSLLADDIVSITVQSATPLQFILGDTVEVYGKTYTLNQLPAIKKTGERRFNYDLTFEGAQYELLDAQFLLPDDTVGESFTGNLFAFLQILISNANRVFPGKWAVGDYPDETEYKTLTFTGENCLSVLQRLCEEYEQEFEIVQTNGTRVLHIRKAGVNFPYTFKYGRTGGLYELMRQNINSKNIVTRLFVYGGSNNVPTNYLANRSSSKLCLPGKNKNTSYIQDAEAVAAFGVKENTKAFDDIFPNRYGEVTATGSKYNAFVDGTMNFDLNEKDAEGNTKWLIAGVNAKVHFNTGNLAGYEFDVHSYDHETKTIELVPFTDENVMKFPSEKSAAFQFAPGDKYFFIDINLPDAYITEAESKLADAGEEYYAQNRQPQVQYGLTIDENFIKQFAGNLTVVNLFAVGDYIPIEDADIGVNKSVRIIGFTRDLLKPYKYAITLGDAVTKSTYTRLIADKIGIDRIIEINNLANPAKARRNWRASQEVLSMVFDPDGDYYSSKIKPLSIETTMLQTGAKSMQFVLQNVIFEPNYQGNPNYIRVSGGNLIHYTIEETIRNWTIAATEFSELVSNTAYYIYARCQKSGSAGSIILDTAQRKVEHEADYYTFMIGVLNSVQTDAGGLRPARLISLTYGSSTINGRFIKTGKIESINGSTYFDLDNSEIGGKIAFKSGSSGYNNITDKPDLSPYDEALNYIDNVLPGTLERLQAQIDDTIESWFYHYDPTLQNAPASDWTTDELKEAHLDDTFTNLDSGQSWRFTRDANNVYNWTLMADSAATKALVLAGQAKDTADGKRRMFVAQPVPPYDIGDLWAQGDEGDLLRCVSDRASGSYKPDDWERASKYTDDTMLNAYKETLKYLTDAIKNGSTEILGGLMLTNLLFIKNLQGVIRAGISGMDDDNVAFFAHDSDAYNVAVAYFLGQSSVRPNFAVSKDGFLMANRGVIGNAEMLNGDLVLTKEDSNIVITNRKVSDISFNSSTIDSTLGNAEVYNTIVGGNPDYTRSDGDTQRLLITLGGLYRITYDVNLHVTTGTVGRSTATASAKVEITIEKNNSVIQTILSESEEIPTSENAGEVVKHLNNSIIANVPAGSYLVFTHYVYCKLTSMYNNGHASCYAGITKSGTTPFVNAAQINKLAMICSDGIIISNDAANKFIITNTGTRISIKVGLPKIGDADTGELCVDNGVVKIK